MPEQLPYERLPYRRFELVKIAFEKRLDGLANGTAPEMDRADVATAIVNDVDAVLAAMDKTPDTVPPAEEIERRALKRVRATLQEALTQDADAFAKNPTTDDRVLGWRDGYDTSTRMALRLIDAAMETTEAENPDAK